MKVWIVASEDDVPLQAFSEEDRAVAAVEELLAQSAAGARRVKIFEVELDPVVAVEAA